MVISLLEMYTCSKGDYEEPDHATRLLAAANRTLSNRTNDHQAYSASQIVCLSPAASSRSVRRGLSARASLPLSRESARATARSPSTFSPGYDAASLYRSFR